MPLNFPDTTSYTGGETYSYNGYVWEWNNESQHWVSISIPIQGPTGAQGIQGSIGSGDGGGGGDGAQGAQGTQGSFGIQGSIGSGSVTSSSLLSNGYAKLDNGLHFIWGTNSIGSNATTTYSFPVGVSLTAFSRVVISGGEGGGGATQNNPYVTTCSTTGFAVFNPRGDTVTFFWIAIGY